MCLAVSGTIRTIASRPPGDDRGGCRSGGGSETVAPASDPLWQMAEVDFGGVRQWVSLACLPEAVVGDRVLVHVGLAIALVEEEDGAWAPLS